MIIFLLDNTKFLFRIVVFLKQFRLLIMNEQTIDLILQAFYEGRSQKTTQLYLSDLDAFRGYLGVGSLKTALLELFKAPHSQANLTVMHYKALMHQNGLKPATINRRLSALRSIVKEAQLNGYVTWEVDVNNEKIRSGHKNLPIGSSEFNDILKRAETQRNSLKSSRDTAILRLLNDLAMQLGSIIKLNINDIDLSRRRILVHVPGSKEKVSKIMPLKTTQALKKWMAHRGGKNGALFTNCDHAGKGKRLTATSIYRIVRQLGKEVGLDVGPLGIRQAAIVKALGKARTSGIKMEDVAAFSDHRHVPTLKTYERQRAAIQQRLSDLVSD